MAQEEAIMRALMEAMAGESGKTISDADRMRISRKMGESGKTISDADIMRLKSMLGKSGAPTKPMRPKMRPMDVTPEAERGDSDLMRMVNGMKKGGVVKKKAAKKPAKKSKNGCVMAGRGGKYKGMR